jgi:hypothetical protein
LEEVKLFIGVLFMLLQQLYRKAGIAVIIFTLFFLSGCMRAVDFTLVDQENQYPIDITTKNNQTYHLRPGWQSDSLGNITGAGFVTSIKDSLPAFHGTIHAEDQLTVEYRDEWTPAYIAIGIVMMSGIIVLKR